MKIRLVDALALTGRLIRWLTTLGSPLVIIVYATQHYFMTGNTMRDGYFAE